MKSSQHRFKSSLRVLFVAILFAAFLSPAYTLAQTFEWGVAEEIEFDLNPEFLNYSVATDTSGCVYYAGLKTYAASFGSNAFGESFFAKYDPDGSQLLHKLIAGQTVITNLDSDHQNNIIMTGMMRSNVAFSAEDTLMYTGAGTNAFVVKFTQHGEVVWMKNLAALYGFSDQIKGVAVDENDNIYVAWSSSANGNSMVSKFSSEGEVLLDILQSAVSVISSIDVSANGDIYVAGSCPGSNAVFGGVPYNSGFTHSIYVARYNQAGQPVWVKFVEDVSCIRPQVRWSPIDKIFLSGRLSAPLTFGNIPTNGPSWVYDFFLASMDTTGSFDWVREVPQTTLGDATTGKLNHLSLDYYGFPYLCGFSRGEIEWTEQWQTNVNARGLLVLAYNPDGDYRWIKTAIGALDAQAIVAFSPEEVYITGIAFEQLYLDDITLSTGSFIFPFLAKIKLVTTGNRLMDQNAIRAKVFPNPMHDAATIAIENATAFIQHLSFRNLEGTLVKDISAESQTVQITRDNLSPGIYLIEIRLSDGNLATTKLVVI
jgi:WD40 repeat protein